MPRAKAQLIGHALRPGMGKMLPFISHLDEISCSSLMDIFNLFLARRIGVVLKNVQLFATDKELENSFRA